MNKMKQLLIVDDERLIVKSLSSMDEWADKNIQVVGTASNGKEALEWIERHPIDIIITDIEMPDMDGLKLLQTVYMRQPNISVVIISGYEHFQYARTALKYKAKGYVLKPIDLDELFGVIDEILLEAGNPSSEPAELRPAAPESAVDPQPAPRTYHEMLMAKAEAYLKQHLDQPVSLNEIAQHFHLTPHYFGQIFKMVLGENFCAHVTRLKMVKASELLKDPELKIYEICQQVGYNDVKYFTKLFYRHYRMTPKEYRKHFFAQAVTIDK